MNKNKLGILLIIVLTIVLIILLCLIFFQNSNTSSKILEEAEEDYQSIVCKQNFGENYSQYTLYYDSDQFVLYFDIYEFSKFKSLEDLKEYSNDLILEYVPFTTIDETNLTIITKIQRKKIDYHEDTKDYEKTLDYHKALYDAAGYVCE